MKIDDVVTGWLLGIISTPTVFFINSYFERRSFLKTLKEELKENRFRLILSIYLLRLQMGIMDRAKLEWIARGVESYPSDPIRDRMLAEQKRLLALSDLLLQVEFAKLVSQSKAIPPTSTPYLTSNMKSIGLLNGRSQRYLVNYLFHISSINSKASEVAQWTSMSFSVGANNYNNVTSNIDKSTLAWINSAEKAVENSDNFFDAADIWNPKELIGSILILVTAAFVVGVLFVRASDFETRLDSFSSEIESLKKENAGSGK